MYLEYWFAEILRNMKSRGDWLGQSGEPTAYHELISNILGTFADWTRMAASMPRELESIKVDNQRLEYDSLAKSVVLSFGTCVRKVMESDVLSAQFKGRKLEMAISTYEHVIAYPALAEFYETVLLSGGRRRDPYDAYRAGLTEAFANVDEVRLRFSDVRRLYDTLFAMAHRGLTPDDRVRTS
jgi:hypothetical protein